MYLDNPMASVAYDAAKAAHTSAPTRSSVARASIGTV